MQKQINLEVDEYVIKVDKKEKRKLNLQRKKLLFKIEETEKKIKKVKFKDSEYSIKIELIGKMKEYVGKYAFLPNSYRNMLIRWNN